MQPPVQDVDVFPELAAFEEVIRLKPHGLVLVLGPDGSCIRGKDEEGDDHGEALATPSAWMDHVTTSHWSEERVQLAP
jgi:hypothetical protein